MNYSLWFCQIRPDPDNDPLKIAEYCKYDTKDDPYFKIMPAKVKPLPVNLPLTVK